MYPLASNIVYDLRQVVSLAFEIQIEMTKYSRAGVEASVRLLSLRDDPVVWDHVAGHYKAMLAQKGGKELVTMDDFCETLSTKLQDEPSISKEDLIKIIQWKFAKGKPRQYMKYIKSNTDEEVKDCSNKAFQEADKGDVDAAISEMTKVKGVGAAGASAILSLYRPDLFCFMDDEVIESLYNGKRAYTKAIYMQVNEECTKLAGALGKRWTTRRVGMALWAAARICASGGHDVTLAKADSNPNKEKRNGTSKSEETGRRRTKRKRT